METLRVAYTLAKKNDGVPGIDGVTFDDIEKQGVEALNGGPASVADHGPFQRNRQATGSRQ